MKHSIFGSTDGHLIVYFHGAPGAPAEAQVFDAPAKAHRLKVICLDRFSVADEVSGEEYFQMLTDEIVRLAQGERVDIVGFSIGAFVALQVCRLIPGQVRGLHLVSPAAPLEGGDFLKNMAGNQVFRLAREWPMLFRLLSYWQGLLARYSPNILFNMLFKSAVAGYKTLAADPNFRLFLGGILKQCFVKNVCGYLRDVLAYVAPWHDNWRTLTVNTQLWHGDQDNWSPLAMSTYLAEQIPASTGIHCLERLSHYSSRYAAVPKICELIGRTSLD